MQRSSALHHHRYTTSLPRSQIVITKSRLSMKCGPWERDREKLKFRRLGGTTELMNCIGRRVLGCSSKEFWGSHLKYIDFQILSPEAQWVLCVGGALQMVLKSKPGGWRPGSNYQSIEPYPCPIITQHLTFLWCHSQTTWCNNFLPNWPRTVLPSNPCGSRRHPEHADSDTLLSVWVPSCHSARETPDGDFSVLHSLDFFHATSTTYSSQAVHQMSPIHICKSVIQHLAKPGTFVNIDLYLAPAIKLTFPGHFISSPVLNHTQTELLRSSHFWILNVSSASPLSCELLPPFCTLALGHSTSSPLPAVDTQKCCYWAPLDQERPSSLSGTERRLGDTMDPLTSNESSTYYASSLTSWMQLWVLDTLQQLI